MDATDESVADDWIQFRERASKQAEDEKQSHATLFSLFERYRDLSEPQRDIIDALLARDLGSNDEALRFDALAVIREFRITRTVPQLRTLAERLEHTNSPGAPYEWAKVNRLIGILVSQDELE
jgi:hypothetical protein